MGRHPTGFTLVEIMVALAVFAVVSIAVYGRIGDVVMGTASLEQRTLGSWVARNHLARLQLDARAAGAAIEPGEGTATVRMADRTWFVETDVARTSAAGLQRVEIRVRTEEAAQGTSANLVAFLQAPDETR